MLFLYDLPDWPMALTVLNVSISPEPFQLVIDNVQRWDREIAKPALENTSHEK